MRSSKKICVSALVAGGMLLGLGSAQADIAIDSPRGQAGTQGQGYSLGEDFAVGASGIIVTSLAAFDPYDANLGTNVPLGTSPYDSIPVKIYYVNVAGHSAGDLVPGLSGVITEADSSFVSPTSSFRALNSFTPVTLGAGTYRVVASNYVNELELNLGNGAGTITSYAGPLISFPGDNSNGFNSYADSPNASANYPTSYIDGPPINRYAAGSFTFTATPEPASLSLFGLGAMGLLARRRRA